MPDNPAKIMPKFAGQSDLLETRNLQLLHFGRLKGGTKYSPFKAESVALKMVLIFWKQFINARLHCHTVKNKPLFPVS